MCFSCNASPWKCKHSKWIHVAIFNIEFHRSKRSESNDQYVQRQKCMKITRYDNNGNNKTIKKNKTTQPHMHIELRRKGEGIVKMKKTHIHCVSNKIKYLTPFARKIQRPLFTRPSERTNKQTNDSIAVCSVELTQWLQVWHLPHSQIHTIAHKYRNEITKFRSSSSFLLRFLFGFCLDFVASARMRTTHIYIHKKCAHSPLSSKRCLCVRALVCIVCIVICGIHFYLLRCKIQSSKSVIRQRDSRKVCFYFHPKPFVERVELSCVEQTIIRVSGPTKRVKCETEQECANAHACVIEFTVLFGVPFLCENETKYADE